MAIPVGAWSVQPAELQELTGLARGVAQRDVVLRVGEPGCGWAADCEAVQAIYVERIADPRDRLKLQDAVEACGLTPRSASALGWLMEAPEPAPPAEFDAGSWIEPHDGVWRHFDGLLDTASDEATVWFQSHGPGRFAASANSRVGGGRSAFQVRLQVDGPGGPLHAGRWRGLPSNVLLVDLPGEGLFTLRIASAKGAGDYRIGYRLWPE